MSKQMLVLELCCPQCNALLTDGVIVRLDGYVRETHQKGEILLSAIFGDYTVVTDLRIEEGWIMDFGCPKCEASIMILQTCKVCGAHNASLDLRSGGYIEFCSRRGCKGHALGGIGDIDEMISLMNRMFETPYD